MAHVVLSEAEKVFILHGVEENFRCDGRSRGDYRPMELETDIVSHAIGSARLRLANTDILVGIKAEIDVPNPGEGDKGKLVFFVDCSANATREFEGRGGEDLAQEISTTLANAYESEEAFDLKSLCIIQNQQCWKLFIDVLILECGGNLFDAVSLCVKAALHNTKIAKITASLIDAGTSDLILSDDPYDCTRINVENIPILVTVCKVGDFCIVDPSAEEEECSKASVVVAVSRRNEENIITNIHTIGSGSFHPETLNNCIELGVSVSTFLDKELKRALEVEEARTSKLVHKEIVGFLR